MVPGVVPVASVGQVVPIVLIQGAWLDEELMQTPELCP
jgi:hypothetical protein